MQRLHHLEPRSSREAAILQLCDDGTASLRQTTMLAVPWKSSALCADYHFALDEIIGRRGRDKLCEIVRDFLLID